MNQRVSISRRSLVTASASLGFTLQTTGRGSARSSARVEYDLIDLSPFLQPGGSSADVMNNRQTVGGTCTITINNLSSLVAFVWDNGTAQLLSDQVGGTDELLIIADINDANVIVGSPLGIVVIGGLIPAFRISGDTYEELEVIDDRGTMAAFGINEAGVIVGTAQGPKSQRLPNAVVWEDGQVSYLDEQGAQESGAFGLNNAGDIVGYVVPEFDKVAAIWIDGSLATLPHTSDGFPDDIAHDVNGAQTVIGTSSRDVGDTHSITSWIWTPDASGLIPLESPKNATTVRATAINEPGVIVGMASNESDDTWGLLWRGGKMIDLDTLLPPNSGWHIIAANDINDRGDIAADAVRVDDPDTSRAVILTPHR